MDVPDVCFVTNRDWDPSSLCDIMAYDWYDFNDHWKSNVTDEDLVKQVECLTIDKYSLLVEDISLDDETLCSAVEKIEHE